MRPSLSELDRLISQARKEVLALERARTVAARLEGRPRRESWITALRALLGDGQEHSVEQLTERLQSAGCYFGRGNLITWLNRAVRSGDVQRVRRGIFRAVGVKS